MFSRRAACDIMEKLRNEKSAPLGEAPPLPNTQGKPLPHGLRTEIRRIMQHTHFVLPTPESVPEGLERIREILNRIKTGGYAFNPDFVEAKSLATVACLILEDVLAEEEK